MPKLTKDEAVQWYAQNRGLYKKLSEKINAIIFELLEESDITVHAITNRTKDVDSFRAKIDDSKYDDPINQITDFSGIRIIAYVDNDLKPICNLIESGFIIDSDNSSDKSDELGTDKVGYKSIHYIASIKDDRLALPEYRKFKELKFEIQVRTILQHAWAEIEHDRNYKFNGVLPSEIQRRFKILAGTLELIDREFNQLSLEIDKISKSVDVAEKTKTLKDIIINSTTLKQFLSTRLEKLIKESIIEFNFNDKDEVIITELKNFGITNLQELNDLIKDDYLEALKSVFGSKNPTLIVGVLRDLMIINNPEKYFKDAWKSNWTVMEQDTLNLFKSLNVSIDSILNQLKISVI